MKIIIRFISGISLVLLIFSQSASAQDDILFRKYVVSSGINGFYYGFAIDLITSASGGAAAGIPVLSAGVSALIPLMSNSARTISENSYVLSGHGKAVGWAHGAALATLIGGEDAWTGNNYKLSVALGAATSIGLGILGKNLGKTTNWSDGQVALYRHYGWVGPFTGISLMAAFSDSPRAYGASVLVFGAGGYLLADRIYKWNEFTRGDVRATQVLSILNGGLGFGIVMSLTENANRDFKRTDLLVPAIGVLSGSMLSHLWLKDIKLSPKQGLMTAYATSGGAVLGLGIALITESDKIAPYYIIPYLTGLGAYAYAVETFRKNNGTQSFTPGAKKSNWDFSFMPQNAILNSKMPSKGYMVNGRLVGMQPLFAASLTF